MKDFFRLRTTALRCVNSTWHSALRCVFRDSSSGSANSAAHQVTTAGISEVANQCKGMEDWGLALLPEVGDDAYVFVCEILNAAIAYLRHVRLTAIAENNKSVKELNLASCTSVTDEGRLFRREGAATLQICCVASGVTALMDADLSSSLQSLNLCSISNLTDCSLMVSYLAQWPRTA